MIDMFNMHPQAPSTYINIILYNMTTLYIHKNSQCNTTLCDGLILGLCLVHKHNDYNMTAMYSDWIWSLACNDNLPICPWESWQQLVSQRFGSTLISFQARPCQPRQCPGEGEPTPWQCHASKLIKWNSCKNPTRGFVSCEYPYLPIRDKQRPG